MQSVHFQHIRISLCSVVLALSAGVAAAPAVAPAQDQQAETDTTLEVEGEVKGDVEGAAGGTAEGTYTGMVMVPDPMNIWTGMRITEQKCTVNISRHEPGSFSVESDFAQDTVIVRTDQIVGENFYMGRFGDNQALVLHIWPHHGILALTHTSFDENGVLNYRGEGNETYTRECLIEPT